MCIETYCDELYSFYIECDDKSYEKTYEYLIIAMNLLTCNVTLCHLSFA